MFNELLPEELIQSDWIESYEKKVEVLWWELVKLNSNIFVLEKILAFPWELFDPIGSKHFWKLGDDARFDSCILSVWKVAVDDSFGGGITLQKLKGEILKHFKKDKDEYLEKFKKLLKEIKFEKKLSIFKPKIREIRHGYVAHLDFEKHIKPTPEEIKARTLLFSELKECRDILNSFFELLCFGRRKALLPIEYHPDVIHPVGVDSRSDVEQILDNLARDSNILNLPEKNPELWSMVARNQLSNEELATLNKYRIKFGLSIV